MLKEGSTVFGPKGDCQPPNFSIRKEHCTVERSGSSVSITPGKGETFVNGKFLTAKMNLKKGDRVCMASEVMLLVFPGEEMEEMEPEAMFEELQNAIEARAAAGGGGGGGGADDAALKARIAELEQKNKDLAEPGSDPAAGAARTTSPIRMRRKSTTRRPRTRHGLSFGRRAPTGSTSRPGC